MAFSSIRHAVINIIISLIISLSILFIDIVISVLLLLLLLLINIYHYAFTIMPPLLRWCRSPLRHCHVTTLLLFRHFSPRHMSFSPYAVSAIAEYITRHCRFRMMLMPLSLRRRCHCWVATLRHYWFISCFDAITYGHALSVDAVYAAATYAWAPCRAAERLYVDMLPHFVVWMPWLRAAAW